MKTRTTMWLLPVLISLLAGCTGCGDKKQQDTDSTSVTETGTTDGTGPSDTSSASATHEPQTDTETASSTATESSIPTELVWIDLPAGEDCGPGCRQVSSTNEVRPKEWDVWNEWLVYNSGTSSEDGCVVWVVNVSKLKYARVPDFYLDLPAGPYSRNSLSRTCMFSPSVYGNSLYYSLFFNDSEPRRSEMIHLDLETGNQEIVWQAQSDTIGDSFKQPTELDAYGQHLVANGGTGDVETYSLGVFEKPWPSKGYTLANGNYGGFKSVWGDIVVFWDTRGEGGYLGSAITGYDFSKKEFFPVIKDEEYQLAPRIHDKSVVYMDFRHGSSSPFDTWANAAIYLKDLATDTTQQITNGEVIAAMPDVHEDGVVWSDYRHCANPNDKNSLEDVEIYGYSLSEKKEYQVTRYPGRMKDIARIWGNKVFVHMYKEKSAGDTAIYMFDDYRKLHTPE